MPHDFMARALLIYREADRVAPYRDALLAARIEPVVAEAIGFVSLDGVDGLLLMGGTDVDPALYGEVPGAHTDPPDVERDRIERNILQQAMDRDLPVLAICRGLQLLNVVQGGTLHQHLEPVERHQVRSSDRAEPVHQVLVENGSHLSRITRADTLAVNSRHHQAIAKLGDKLQVTARSSEDGIIEGVERTDRSFVVAVQWHPEDQVFRFPEQLALFTAFGNACAAARQTQKVETYR